MLQVSDPHFGTERPHVAAALLQLAAAQRPDVLVLSGDITQRARRRQFDAARAFVDAMALPRVVAIPGNHDLPLYDLRARLVRPYGNYMRSFGTELEPIVTTSDAVVLGVNTTRPHRHKHGEVSDAQIARVAQCLRDAAPGQVRLVVVHQPVLAIDSSDTRNVLRGAPRAVQEWSAAGADVILGGHIHLPYVRWLRSAYPGIERDFVTVQAGTALSTRVRDGVPNSVNLFRCATSPLGRQCRVERWDYAATAGGFARVESHEFRFLPLD